MSQILNERFSYNNPPHFACAAVTDWQVFDDGERISVDRLVSKANQQEQHIQDLLSEIQQLREQVSKSTVLQLDQPNAVGYVSEATTFSTN